MKILGIIPARGGSKGVPGKNSKLLAGKPLISYSIEAAQESNLITDLVISSEDNSILDIAKNKGVKYIIKRPAELATDESPTILTVIHTLNYFKDKNIEFDAICLLQPTSPFRTGNFIDKAVEQFKQSKSDALVSVIEVPHNYNPHWVFEEDENKNLKISTGEKQIISRRQELPKAFIRDGSIYITKTTVLFNMESLFGNSLSYIKSDIKSYINIDTLDDWNEAEEILKT